MVYDTTWSRNAKCLGLPVELFFDEYEDKSECVDRLCNSCPIQRDCFVVGISRKETGVWGGIYLIDGQIDNDLNLHKTNDDWHSIWMKMTMKTDM